MDRWIDGWMDEEERRKREGEGREEGFYKKGMDASFTAVRPAHSLL
jgi:hypothetical protein